MPQSREDLMTDSLGRSLLRGAELQYSINTGERPVLLSNKLIICQLPFVHTSTAVSTEAISYRAINDSTSCCQSLTSLIRATAEVRGHSSHHSGLSQCPGASHLLSPFLLVSRAPDRSTRNRCTCTSLSGTPLASRSRSLPITRADLWVRGVCGLVRPDTSRRGSREPS